MGDNLRSLRRSRGWSQEDLAAASGLSVRTVQRVENGRSPGPETLQSLAAAFAVDVEQLWGGPPVIGDANEEAREHILWFRVHCAIYAIFVLTLALIDVAFMPEVTWWYWVALFWLPGLAVHWVTARALAGPFRLWPR